MPARTRSPHVRSVHVGLPETFACPAGGTMRSAVRKLAVDGPVEVTATGLAGDGVSDPSHGGDVHLHVFPHDHYAWFEERAGRPLRVPTFGENLALAGLDETDVRVGDVVRVGTATFVVAQPTIRCGTLGRAAGLPRLLEWIQERLFTGFYLRVATPGSLEAGDDWAVLRRGPAELTISRLNHAMFREPLTDASVAALTARPEIAEPWKASLRRKLERVRAAGKS